MPHVLEEDPGRVTWEEWNILWATSSASSVLCQASFRSQERDIYCQHPQCSNSSSVLGSFYCFVLLACSAVCFRARVCVEGISGSEFGAGTEHWKSGHIQCFSRAERATARSGLVFGCERFIGLVVPSSCFLILVHNFVNLTGGVTIMTGRMLGVGNAEGLDAFPHPYS